MEKKRTNIIFILAICTIMAIILIGILYYIVQHKKDEQKNTIQQEEIVDLTDIETISYKGTFQAKGVIVKVENDYFTIMPIMANEEYRYEENFFIENNEIQNLKQGQEVLVTFSYPRFMQGDDKPIVEKVEILKEKSDIEIPRDVLVKSL